jgi:hypothetical protein
MLARLPHRLISINKRWASTLPSRNRAFPLGSSKVISPPNIKPAPAPAEPKVELPAHLPTSWKHNNRFLKPALIAAVREEYKQKVITKKPEPLWSRVIQFLNFIVCTCTPPFKNSAHVGFVTYALFFIDYGPNWNVMTDVIDLTRDVADVASGKDR